MSTNMRLPIEDDDIIFVKATRPPTPYVQHNEDSQSNLEVELENPITCYSNSQSDDEIESVTDDEDDQWDGHTYATVQEIHNEFGPLRVQRELHGYADPAPVILISPNEICDVCASKIYSYNNIEASSEDLCVFCHGRVTKSTLIKLRID